MRSGLVQMSNVRIAETNIPGPDDFLTRDEIAQLTPAIVIERVRALAPLIAEHRLASERRRIPVPEVWNALRKTGYFYLMVPKIWGGLEATFDDMLDATFAICEADPAMGWLCSFAVMNPRSAAPFSDRALSEMFGDGETIGNGRFTVLNTLVAPFGRASRTSGGWCVSGTWHWGTTVQMADWISVMCHYESSTGELKLGTFLLPAKDSVVLDTWTADGLIATGTHHVKIENAFVPDYRTVPFTLGEDAWLEHIRSRFDYPIFRANLRNALSTTIAVALVGTAIGAVNRYTALLRSWTKRGDADLEKENQASQIRLAHVHAKARACEIQLRDIAKRTYDLSVESLPVQAELADAVACEIAYVSHMARDVVLEISKGLGTSAHYVEEPMSQYVRDIVVGSTHRAVNWDSYMIVSGRHLLGLEPLAPVKSGRAY